MARHHHPTSVPLPFQIVLWPHPALKAVCEPVDLGADTEFRTQLEQMKMVLLASGGIGLAANQVGIKKRMLLTFGPSGPQAFVNPRVIGYAGTWYSPSEGCLSLPGITVSHRRNTEVIVESVDLDTGALFAQAYEGRLAHILQHEIDHLDGKTMVDNLPGGRKDQVRQHMKNLKGRR
jgi:peptide deformylase